MGSSAPDRIRLRPGCSTLGTLISSHTSPKSVAFLALAIQLYISPGPSRLRTIFWGNKTKSAGILTNAPIFCIPTSVHHPREDALRTRSWPTFWLVHSSGQTAYAYASPSQFPSDRITPKRHRLCTYSNG